jgi:hypothetical protein
MYWLITAPASRTRSDVKQFCDWVLDHAALTREAIGDTGMA